MGAEGIKISTAGRLGGARKLGVRTEGYKEVELHLHTFRGGY